MDKITEDELNKAVGGDDVEQVSDLAADLAEDTAEPAQEVAEPAEEPEIKDEAQPEEPEQPETTDTEEPAQEPETTESEPEPEKEPELILGKFKTQKDLEDAYKNLEKRFGEKAQEVKQVEQVKSDDFDNAVRQKIAEENWKLVDKAFETIADPENAKEAQYLLMQFKKTGDGSFLEKARGYLDARVDRRLEVDAMNMAAKIQQTANAHRQEILMKPLSDELDKMAEEDPEFMNDTQNQDLMAMAIKLNPTTVDVRAVKKAIQDYSKSQYQKGYEAAKKEYAKQAEKKAVPVKSKGHVEPPAPQKNYDDMSITEQLEEEYKDISLL